MMQPSSHISCGQQDGLNKITVKDYIENRGDYLANGRSNKGNVAQRAARDG
ncbi:polymorphic toxin type 15 domain-containing protein [Streptococcus ruminantium]|uniref:polymorphic toxin type 15 domain-containing protein n=1 Tax=Streptococcus ruminantium TaxID=1917441 RepID=UPI0012DBEBBD